MHKIFIGLSVFFLCACSSVFEETSTQIASSPQGKSGTAGVKTQRYSERDEDIYRERYRRFMDGVLTGASFVYDPLEDVNGADNAVPLPRKDETNIVPEALQSVIRYAENTNTKAFIIYQDGAVVLERYYDDTTRESLLNAKSLAKPLGVIAVGRAIEKGYIDSLETPVATYIDEWRDKPHQAILIRHLLDMRSGLLPQALATEEEDILNRAYLHPRHEDILIHNYPLTDPPGQVYEYSNANSELVAIVIERATGKTYQDWISQEVLSPIGAAGGTIWINREGGVAHAGCCIQLPAETWLRLGILLLNKGVWNGESLVSPAFIKDMLTATPQNRFTGMGVHLGSEFAEWRGVLNPERAFDRRYHSEPYLDKDLFLFDGNSNQVVYMIPSRNIVILRMGDTPPKQPVWDNAFLPNTILRGL